MRFTGSTKLLGATLVLGVAGLLLPGAAGDVASFVWLGVFPGLAEVIDANVAAVMSFAVESSVEMTRRAAELQLNTPEARVVAHRNLVELFRSQLGLEDFDLFAQRIREENVKDRRLPAISWDRRTGRTTRAMIRVLAKARLDEARTLLVIGSSNSQDNDLCRLAIDMINRLGLRLPSAIRPAPPSIREMTRAMDDPNIALFLDHHYVERGRR